MDFQVTFQADALLYGNYNVRMTSKIMFRKFPALNQNNLTSLTNLKHLLLLKKSIWHHGFIFMILSVSFSVGSILFY